MTLKGNEYNSKTANLKVSHFVQTLNGGVANDKSPLSIVNQIPSQQVPGVKTTLLRVLKDLFSFVLLVTLYLSCAQECAIEKRALRDKGFIGA